MAPGEGPLARLLTNKIAISFCLPLLSVTLGYALLVPVGRPCSDVTERDHSSHGHDLSEPDRDERVLDGSARVRKQPHRRPLGVGALHELVPERTEPLEGDCDAVPCQTAHGGARGAADGSECLEGPRRERVAFRHACARGAAGWSMRNLEDCERGARLRENTFAAHWRLSLMK